MNGAFLYHSRPTGMRGATLYPLNLLRSAHPDIYRRARRKYDGREALCELRIPLLDVLWGDAVHLAPVHPFRLAEAWRAAGLSSPAWQRPFLRIPVDRIVGPAVWFESGKLAGDGSLPAEAVTRFDPTRYRELDHPPAPYLDYLRGRQAGEGPPRPFAYVPHVLVAAPIDVAGAALVRGDAPR